MNLLTGLFFILIPNLVLWGFLFLFPPIVVKVSRILWGRINAQGLSFLNFIFIRKDCFELGEDYAEKVIKHEYAHLVQQRIFSPVGLALILLIHYGWLYAKYRSFSAVYRNSFIEKWANRKMHDGKPIPQRMWWING